MMIGIVIGVMVLLVVGIIYFGGKPATKKRSRDEYLLFLQKYLEGRLEPISGYENSYRITFNFEGKSYYYEDYETKGMNENVYKTYIKANTPSQLSLEFREKERARLVNPGAEDNIINANQVKVPLALKQFTIYANNPAYANEILKDPKIVKIFQEFKNTDNRGKPFNSFKILNGTVILDFHTSGHYHPKPIYLLSSMEVVESYLDKMSIIVSKLSR